MIDSGYLEESEGIIQKLREVPTLSFFEEKDLQGILKLSKMKKYDKGDIIIKEGEYDNWIYFLILGRVAIQKLGRTIRVLKRRGDIFGEMGIIDGSPRSASVVAMEETVCLAIDASYMDRLKDGERVLFNSILFQVFSEVLAERLRNTNEALVKAREEIEKLRAEP